MLGWPAGGGDGMVCCSEPLCFGLLVSREREHCFLSVNWESSETFLPPNDPISRVVSPQYQSHHLHHTPVHASVSIAPHSTEWVKMLECYTESTGLKGNWA